MAPWLLAAIPGVAAGVANVVGNIFGAGRQGKHNMSLAKFQNEYNSPKNQMARYREAGLNPNLIYSQGNPGNMTPITPANIQGAYSNLGSNYLAASQTAAQTTLAEQKTLESGIKQEMMGAQKNLINANPYLSPGYVDAMVTQMAANAAIKQQEAEFLTGEQKPTGATTQGQAKMILEVNRLAQQYELGQLDKEIKAKVLQSKEFQNSLQEIQLKWLKDGDVTPQHFFQGIMLLLQKMM